MDDPKHLEQRLARLEQTVARLEERLGSATVTRSTSPTGPVPPIRKNKATTKTLYPGARWALGLGGFVMLYLAPIIGAFAFLGLLLMLMAFIWPFKQPIPGTQKEGNGSQPVSAQPRQRSAFELDLAKHWFSWLGIISLVVGVGLFLQYSLRELGPIGNIITAYAVAGMLFGLWAWFRKRYRGFGFILQSGGWAIVYLATYAWQSVAGSSIASPAVAGTLLLLVVICLLLSAIEQRSRTLTAGAFLLGFITAITNSVDIFTLGSLVALATGLAIVSTFQRWPMLLLWGNLAVYVVHFLWMMNERSAFADLAGLSATFLIIEVLIFGAAHWLIKPATKNDQLVMSAGTVTNLSGFFVLFQFTANSTNNPQVWIATLFLAIVCGLLAFATTLTRDRQWLRSIYIVFAIAFLTIAMAQKFKDEALILGWLVEGAALVVAGALSGSYITRICGSIVSVGAFFGLIAVLGTNRDFGTTGISSRVIFGPLSVVLYSAIAETLRLVRPRLRNEERYTPTVWIDAAIGVALLTTFLQWPAAWGVGITVIIAAIMLVVGTIIRSGNGRWGGLVLLLVAFLVWLSVVAPSLAQAGSLGINARFMSGLVLVFVAYGLSWWLTKQRHRLPISEQRLGEGVAWLGLVYLTVIVGIEAPIRLLSIYWGLIGISLYLYGFTLKSVAARRQGLFIIALTIVKVYLYDVRLLERSYQILSFILLGGILLGIGFLYNRWRQNQPTKPPTP